MKFKNKNIEINLLDNEEVLYIPNKNKIECLICPIWALFCFCFLLFCFSAIILIFEPKSILYALFLMFFVILSRNELYQYIRDSIFTKIVLTNNRIIIFRFNNIISINYSEIKKISYHYGTREASYVKLLLNSNKMHKVNFIPEEQFKAKIEEIYPDLKYKNCFIFAQEQLKSLKLTLLKRQ